MATWVNGAILDGGIVTESNVVIPGAGRRPSR
jgi:hypothetical protein